MVLLAEVRDGVAVGDYGFGVRGLGQGGQG